VDTRQTDDTVQLAMAATGARGLAVSVVDDGQAVFTKAYGVRNASGDPLQVDTVMYGASLTKAAFGYRVMQLVEEGKLGLDVPIASCWKQPLPSCASPDMVRRYSAFAGLANDERWRWRTARRRIHSRWTAGALTTRAAGCAHRAPWTPASPTWAGSPRALCVETE
jgi:CubicO group peptidase (beta-lactamase class C family)